MTTPTTKAPTMDKLSPEDLQRVVRANAVHIAASDRLQQVQDAVSKARDAVVGAQAVLVHLSQEMGEKYGMKDGDTLDQDGAVIRKAG